jgi:riboflavin transporter FmnP
MKEAEFPLCTQLILRRAVTLEACMKKEFIRVVFFFKAENATRTNRPWRKKGLIMTDLKATPKSTQSPDTMRFTNTNRWDTKQLVTMALMCAIGILLSFIEFPLIPGVSFLKYDASCMPAMVVGFAFGGGAGVIVGVVGAIIHGIMMGDFVGAIMNIIVVLAMVLPSAAVYRKGRTFKNAVIGLTIAVVVATIAAVVANLVIDPVLYGMPFDTVVAMVIPALLPFNIVKAIINSALTVIIYKSISNLITPKKKQVRGR